MIVDRLASTKITFEGKAEDKLSEAVRLHIEAHKDITLIDVVKFLYQSVLGSHHLLDHMTGTEIAAWIRKSIEAAQPKEEPLIEKLYRNKWARVNLGAFKQKQGDDYNLLAKLFNQGKEEERASLTELSFELNSLLKLVKAGKIKPLDSNLKLLDPAADFLANYREKCFPPLHHSQLYSEKSPQYVVVSLHSLHLLSSFGPRNGSI